MPCFTGSGGKTQDAPGLPVLALIAMGVIAYIMVASTAVWKHDASLNALMNGLALYGLACVAVSLVGFGLMIVDIVIHHQRIAWSIVMLLSAIAYAAANFVALFVTIASDRFAIFEPAYALAVVVIAPAVAMALLLVIAAVRKSVGWFGLVGCITCIAAAGLTHFWLIAAAMQSV